MRITMGIHQRVNWMLESIGVPRASGSGGVVICNVGMKLQNASAASGRKDTRGRRISPKNLYRTHKVQSHGKRRIGEGGRSREMPVSDSL